MPFSMVLRSKTSQQSFQSHLFRILLPPRTMNRLFARFSLFILVVSTILMVAKGEDKAKAVTGTGDKQRCCTGRFNFFCTGCRIPSRDLISVNGCFSGTYNFCSEFDYCRYSNGRCRCRFTNRCCY